MTDPQHNAWPLPPMDETPDVCAGTMDDWFKTAMVYIPPSPDVVDYRQVAYAAHRRAHAEAIGRPYPDVRHPVWPR